MGAWGYKPFENDTSLDQLYDFLETLLKSPQTRSFIKGYVSTLLDIQNQEESCLLMGVAMVDASINKSDLDILGDISAYNVLYHLPKLTELIPQALEVLDYLIAQGVDDWADAVQQDRMNLYYTYKKRLSGTYDN